MKLLSVAVNNRYTCMVYTKSISVVRLPDRYLPVLSDGQGYFYILPL